jgi:DnaJ homolog subfamily A member 2
MIAGQGMPSYRHHDFGNMYIQFTVKFPEKNWTDNPAAFEQLRAILPPPALINVPPQDAVTDPAELEDPPESQQNNGTKGGFPGNPMDVDDDDGPQTERVQCASQ